DQLGIEVGAASLADVRTLKAPSSVTRIDRQGQGRAPGRCQGGRRVRSCLVTPVRAYVVGEIGNIAVIQRPRKTRHGLNTVAGRNALQDYSERIERLGCDHRRISGEWGNRADGTLAVCLMAGRTIVRVQ